MVPFVRFGFGSRSDLTRAMAWLASPRNAKRELVFFPRQSVVSRSLIRRRKRGIDRCVGRLHDTTSLCGGVVSGEGPRKGLEGGTKTRRDERRIRTISSRTMAFLSFEGCVFLCCTCVDVVLSNLPTSRPDLSCSIEIECQIGLDEKTILFWIRTKRIDASNSVPFRHRRLAREGQRCVRWRSSLLACVVRET